MVRLDDHATIGTLVSELKPQVSSELLPLWQSQGFIVLHVGLPIKYPLKNSHLRFMMAGAIRDLIRKRKPINFQLVVQDGL